MRTRSLRDIEVSEVGMGCMAFSHGSLERLQTDRVDYITGFKQFWLPCNAVVAGNDSVLCFRPLK